MNYWTSITNRYQQPTPNAVKVFSLNSKQKKKMPSFSVTQYFLHWDVLKSKWARMDLLWIILNCFIIRIFELAKKCYLVSTNFLCFSCQFSNNIHETRPLVNFLCIGNFFFFWYLTFKGWHMLFTHIHKRNGHFSFIFPRRVSEIFVSVFMGYS